MATDELTTEFQSLPIDTEKKIMLELKYSSAEEGSLHYKAFAEENSDGTFSINVDEIELDIEWSVKRDVLCFGRYIYIYIFFFFFFFKW